MRAKTVTAEQLIGLMEEEFAGGRAVSLTVTGSSMEPFLRGERDQVLLVAPERGPLRAGEIILFRRDDGSCVLHRVLKVENNVFTVNGDAQTWTEKVQKRQILAAAEGLVRKGCYLSCDRPLYRWINAFWRFGRPLRKILFQLADIFAAVKPKR